MTTFTDDSDIDVKEDSRRIYEEPDQLSDLVTISDVAHSRWFNLLDLKTIKVCVCDDGGGTGCGGGVGAGGGGGAGVGVGSLRLVFYNMQSYYFEY